MIRPPTVEVPDAPGAYMFKDAHGRVIYVGKALSIRKRTSNYFARELGERTRAMVESAESLEWIITDSEVAAVMLEYSLIKTHRPRFNIRLVDDKSYPYLAITRSDEWPRARVMRGAKRKGVEYFGPYAHTYAIRSTLDLLLRTFPIRTCTDALFKRQRAQGRPCLLFHIEKCTGPCVGEVTHEVYDKDCGWAGRVSPGRHRGGHRRASARRCSTPRAARSTSWPPAIEIGCATSNVRPSARRW